MPRPSPNAPVAPSFLGPASSSAAVSRAAFRAGSVSDTTPDAVLSSSNPLTVTSTACASGLMSRSTLCWFTLLPGLNVGMYCVLSATSARSWIDVRNPSTVRTYARASMSRLLSSTSRQSPEPPPVAPDSPLAVFPYSRSSEFRWMTQRAPIANDSADGS